METHDHEQTASGHLLRSVLADHENVRGQVAFVHTIGGEDESAGDERADDASRCDVATLPKFHCRLPRA